MAKSYSDQEIKLWSQNFAGIYSSENDGYRSRFRSELNDHQRGLFDLETARCHLAFEMKVHNQIGSCIKQAEQLELFKER
jgi:hypothetical protein